MSAHNDLKDPKDKDGGLPSFNRYMKGKDAGVRKYVARPVVVEAVMLRHGNLEEVLDWVGGDSYGGQDSSGVYIHINTLEGYMAANQDDYVVRGTHGEFYPVKNDIFNHKYEEYDDEV